LNFIRAGKNYTLRGGENKEAGVIIQSIECLLNMIEISKQAKSPIKTCRFTARNSEKQEKLQEFKVYASIFGVYNNELYDLIALKGKKINVNMKNLKELTVFFDRLKKKMISR